MKKVISVSLLLLLNVSIRCQGSPQPQKYNVRESDVATQYSVASNLDSQGALSVRSVGYSGDNFQSSTEQPSRFSKSNGASRPKSNQRSSSQSGQPRIPQKPMDGEAASPVDDHYWETTTIRNPEWQRPVSGKQPATAAGQSNVEENEGRVCGPSDGKMKYDYPGSKYPGTDYSKTFCCAEHFPTNARTNEESADNSRTVNNHLRQFALDLLIELVEREPEMNLVISPYSVWNVLLIMLEGTRSESKTASEIRSALHLNDTTLAKIQLNFRILECSLRNASKSATYVSANGLFDDINRPAKQQFVGTVQNKYQADIISLNFTEKRESVKQINQWVANKTQNRITKFVKAGDITGHNLVIANVVLFKGQWNNPFNVTATEKANFFNEKKQIISRVDMMYQRGDFLYSFIQEINAHVLDIPYVGANFRMLIVLPKYNGSVKASLKLMKKFPVDLCYERLVHEQEMYSDEEVHVFLPRFKIKSDLQLKEALQSLGIQRVFTNDAELTEISHLELYLSKLIHSAEIEVNEEGTIASAASGGLFGNKSKPPNFVANRPFGYFIVENNRKTVIFAGKVFNPSTKL